MLIKLLRLSGLVAALGLGLAPTAPGAVRITEFLAANLRGLEDEDGNREDWIEIFNDGPASVSLHNWCLTDNAGNLTKWLFPNTNIGPGQFIVVFASDKNRRVPGQPLHTNFKLGADGEYLALVQADGVTIASQFAPTFPAQATDISYGYPGETKQAALTKGASVQWRVWPNATAYEDFSPGWNTSLAYAPSGWSNGTSGLGWDDSLTVVNYTGYFGTNANPRSQMFGEPRSLFTRFRPNLTNVASASALRLRLRYTDGFIAWLNGTVVASNLAPANPSWNSLATGNRSDTLNAAWATFNLPLSAAVTGTNLLAIQSFGSATNATDLLLLPELDLVFPGAAPTPAYLFATTPGQSNSAALAVVPPTVELRSSAPRPPGGAGSPPLTVAVLVTPTLAPVTNVTLFYRLMYSNEIAVVMPPGTGGVYTVAIPTTGLNPGAMLRWRIEAQDNTGTSGTGPLFLDANDDDRYYGTVALNRDETNSHLPILHWFTEDFAGTQDRTGTRGAFFYLDRFYDNIRTDLHGQSTAGNAFPKKSHDLDFNRANRFVWREGETPAKDVNLLTSWADKSKVRNTIAYEMFNRAGVPSHWAFPVRVQTNGNFYSIHDLVEDGDDRYLERVGLDPDGALYKMARTAPDGGVSGANIWQGEKKTRFSEGNTDLAGFSSGVAATGPMAQRRNYAYDNVNLAATVNYLAALGLSSCGDQGHKNFYLYRDSNGTREWQPLPWDVDLTFGHDWISGPGYFWDVINTTQPLQLGTLNNLKTVIFNNPELNAMFLRRLRTLMDTVLQPAGTPAETLIWENRIAELLDQMDPPSVAVSDAAQDFTKWGWWTNSTRQVSPNPNQEMRPQAQRILDSFLPGRRAYLASSPVSSGAPIPPSQNPAVLIAVEIGDYNPIGGNQEQEYLVLRNTNNYAVDVSGWKLSRGINYELPPGTVIPPGGGVTGNVGALFVAKNPYAFRQRATGPGSNQLCFVSGPYSGQLSARGETVELHDHTERFVASVSYPGSPSLAQQFLRITELMYHPAPLAGSPYDAQEFEYVELRNLSPGVTLNLNGLKFTRGISFAFTNPTLLGPQQSLLLVRNPTAFTTRYGGGFNIVGPYDGSLDNGGERLTLLDAVNEEILDFTYNDNWHPLTDGLGFSLVVVNELAAPDDWDSKSNWRASGARHGSPGAVDILPAFSPILVNEVLTHTDLPQLDSVELFNPTGTNVNLGGWFLTDNFFAPKKYRIPNGTTIPAGGFLVFNENQFNTGPNAFRFSEMGEFVYLFSGDPNTNLTGYVHGYEFGEAPNGVSFGRYVNSQGEGSFVLQSAVTLGGANAYPRVGPIVISEIMYHPAPVHGTNNVLDEFIELQNIVATNVPLYFPGVPTNTWRLRNAVDFDFPTNQTLAAGARLLVVGFDPANSAQLAAFRARYGVSNSVAVYGPWAGRLDNTGETIELKQPDDPDLVGGVLFTPFIMIDQVAYRDAAPWPPGADGIGNSLQRVSLSGFGNDPTNWFAAGVTAGRANLPNLAPTVTITVPAAGAIVSATNGVTVSVVAADPDGTIALVKLLANGVVIRQWTTASSNYFWGNPPGGAQTLQAIATDNLGAVSISSNILIHVVIPPPVAPGGLLATAFSAAQINLTWSDNSTNENNFLIERSFDNITYTQIDSVGAGGTNYADTGLAASTLHYYRVRAGNDSGPSAYSGVASASTLAPPTELIWRGDGAANVWNVGLAANWEQGGNFVQYADGANVIFDHNGLNTPAINLVGTLSPASVHVTSAQSYTFDGSGSLAGPMTLTKSGSGSFTVNTSHTFSGGTILSNSTLVLGNAPANIGGLGPGPITFYGGSLNFNGITGSSTPDYGGNTNALIIPTGHTGTVRVPQRFLSPGLAGPVAGGGTLNLIVNYVRGDIRGDWTAFTGVVNVSPASSPDDFRVVTETGFPQARLHLANGIVMYSRLTAGAVIPIGAFSADTGAVVSAGTGSGAGQHNAMTLQVGGLNTDATNAATIQGPVTLIKEGDGTWILTGPNTYTGLTTISGGTVQVGNGGTSGGIGANSIFNDGTLAFRRSDPVADSAFGLVSGTGNLAQRGTGRLALSNPHPYSGTTFIEAGILALTNSGALPNSANFNISGGALFDVSGRTGGGLTLGSGQTVTGSGSVKGNLTLTSGAALAPGSFIGTLTFSNALILQAGSTTRIEIQKAPHPNDLVRVLGALTHGGTLVVTNVGATPLAAGDSFQLFTAATRSGSFSGINLPSLNSGLAWNTNALLTSGTIFVISIAPPMFNSVAAIGAGGLRLNFSGPTGFNYEVRASTNVALTPITTWTVLTTGTFTAGPVVFDDLTATNQAQRFYRIRLP